MDKHKITYKGDPNLPKVSRHTANLANCTEEFEEEFDNSEDALTFWFECSRPLTDLCDLDLSHESLEDIDIHGLIEDQEKQYLSDKYYSS